jgi:hypothetical protein
LGAKVSRGHDVHVCNPSAENLPASHSVQTVAPSVAEYLPAGHFVHALSDDAPVTVENLPAAQGVHVCAPAPE